MYQIGFIRKTTFIFLLVYYLCIPDGGYFCIIFLCVFFFSALSVSRIHFNLYHFSFVCFCVCFFPSSSFHFPNLSIILRLHVIHLSAMLVNTLNLLRYLCDSLASFLFSPNSTEYCKSNRDGARLCQIVQILNYS